MCYLYIAGLGWLSFLFIGTGVLVWIRKKKPAWSFKLVLLLFIFVLILILRIFVNMAGAGYLDDLKALNATERLLDSIVQTFQTFSMDADYTGYVKAGRWIFEEAGMAVPAAVYSVLNSLLNVIAPLVGGFILLEVLTGIFPGWRMLWHFRDRKFVFSELNEASMTLAEDLMARDSEGTYNYQKVFFWDKRKNKPLFLFTDAYPDRQSEVTSELFERAKEIGACCVRTDILHLSFRFSRSVHYFLMDTDEHVNVSAIARLLEGDAAGKVLWPMGDEIIEDDSMRKECREEKEKKRGRGELELAGGKTSNLQETIPKSDPPLKDPLTRAYVFCQSELCVEIINKLCRDSSHNEDILIRPLRDYANAAILLMNDAPLFLPFLGRKSRNAGGGGAGQTSAAAAEGLSAKPESNARREGIVPDRDLHVAILGSGMIAEETLKAVFWCGQMAGIQLHIHVVAKEGGAMWQRIYNRCPEIEKSCDPNSDVLQLYPHNKSTKLANPPYAIRETSGETVDAENPLDYPEILKQADYVIVALGDDERNLSVTANLSREISRRILEDPGRARPVIAPAIFAPRLAHIVRSPEPGDYDPYIIPFAMMDLRFSCRNVFMADYTETALKGEKMYNQKANLERQKDEYVYWANVIRAVHAPYKLFAMGCIEEMRIDKDDTFHFKWRSLDLTDDLNFAWMEHRRWVAYLRTCGFCLPTPKQHQLYFEKTGEHKNLAGKLHNCLVECSLRGRTMPSEDSFDPDDYDALDMVSIEAYRMDCRKKNKSWNAADLQSAEYKHWDYYEEDAGARKIMESIDILGF